MRLDKFLKNSRLIKRRPLAKKVADEGRIKINGNVAKAATNVEVGDELEIKFGKNLVTLHVKQVEDHIKKQDASMMYEILKEERINE